MYKKSKKRSHFPQDNKKDEPGYDSLVNLWEAAEENDITDRLGSYTGRPHDGGIPEQDADDL